MAHQGPVGFPPQATEGGELCGGQGLWGEDKVLSLPYHLHFTPCQTLFALSSRDPQPSGKSRAVLPQKAQDAAPSLPPSDACGRQDEEQGRAQVGRE